MSTNLRELLDERSRLPGGAAGHARLAGIRARVVARRRRRLVVAGFAAAILAAVPVALTALPDRAGPPQPADRLAGFAEFADGARVVAATSGPRSDRSVQLRFTPPARDLVAFVRCDAPGDAAPVGAELRVNGALVWNLREPGTPRGFCTRPDRTEAIRLADSPGLAEAGLRAGEPATLTFSVVHARDMGLDEQNRIVVGPGAVPLFGGTIALAVGERVGFEDYRLPARPDPLPALVVPEQGQYDLLLRADPADPNRPLEASIRWPGSRQYQVQVGTQTPGYLTVLVDGVEAGRVELWEYGQTCHGGMVLTWPGLREAGLRALPGNPVTVTVRPAHQTGDWYLRLNPIVGSLSC